MLGVNGRSREEPICCCVLLIRAFCRSSVALAPLSDLFWSKSYLCGGRPGSRLGVGSLSRIRRRPETAVCTDWSAPSPAEACGKTYRGHRGHASCPSFALAATLTAVPHGLTMRGTAPGRTSLEPRATSSGLISRAGSGHRPSGLCVTKMTFSLEVALHVKGKNCEFQADPILAL